jgi:hypothetical protein
MTCDLIRFDLKKEERKDDIEKAQRERVTIVEEPGQDTNTPIEDGLGNVYR